MKKRGDRKKLVISSSTILNAKNIIFMLVILLLLIIIVYFAIKTWPIIQERFSDEDNDGIKNYEDKCPNTLKGTIVDQFGCELEKSTQEEKSTPVKEKPTKVNEEPIKVEEKVCSDSDGGKDIWNKGICKDTIENKDYCKENFLDKLYEYECLDNTCTRDAIDCSDYSALCYDGRCIEKTKDSDKDGYPDLEELKYDTDPFDADDHPGNITIQNNCNSRCTSLGYVSGRGPFDSIGRCNSPEVGKYISGNSGNICCCTPSIQCTDTDNGKDDIYTKGTCNDGTRITDSCASTYYVNENWCENNHCMGASIQCPANYVCSDGKCIYMETGYYNFQQCLSLQSSHNAEASWRIGYDWTSATCEEYAKAHCSSANNIGFDRNCCWWSCNQASACSDSDGGLVYNTKGTVTLSGSSNTDYCAATARPKGASIDGGFLYEYSCVSGASQKSTITCNNVIPGTMCNDGQCIATHCDNWCIDNGFAAGWSVADFTGSCYDKGYSACAPAGGIKHTPTVISFTPNDCCCWSCGVHTWV